MSTFFTSHHAVYAVAAVSTIGVVARPWGLPEALWASAGGLALVLLGLMPWAEAASAVARGADVYMFLVGMMLLAEMARAEGLFDYVATVCVRSARGSATRLFFLVYVVGTVVTAFMSNDATAVVLTPAVLAVSRKAKANALPYLLACAFVANAASFVLPISNPANLVVFGDKLPSLATWVWRFLLPSTLAIASTFGILRFFARHELSAAIASDVELPELTRAGVLVAMGIAATAVALLVASTLGLSLGLPTLLASAGILAINAARQRKLPTTVFKNISWSVLVLVAGLFVLVEGLQRAGVLDMLAGILRPAGAASTVATATAAGAIVAVACNLVNNLPAGLIAGLVAGNAGVTALTQSAIAIGVDLGPNLSVTGSLATILWLLAIRREGENVTAWQFLRVGAVTMPVALTFALSALVIQAIIAQ